MGHIFYGKCRNWYLISRYDFSVISWLIGGIEKLLLWILSQNIQVEFIAEISPQGENCWFARL